MNCRSSLRPARPTTWPPRGCARPRLRLRLGHGQHLCARAGTGPLCTGAHAPHSRHAHNWAKPGERDAVISSWWAISTTWTWVRCSTAWHRRAHGPPLRRAADAPSGRGGHGARLLRPLQHPRGGGTPWPKASKGLPRCSEASSLVIHPCRGQVITPSLRGTDGLIRFLVPLLPRVHFPFFVRQGIECFVSFFFG